MQISSVFVKTKGTSPIPCQFKTSDAAIQHLAKRGEKSKLAQLLYIVKEQMSSPKHVFRGLNRPMKVNGEEKEDRSFDAYVLTPEVDHEFSHHEQRGIRKTAPRDSVFVVLVRIYPTIAPCGSQGEVVHWSWIEDGSPPPFAPKDHANRYDDHLWSAQ